MASAVGFLLTGPVSGVIGIGHQPLHGVAVQPRDGSADNFANLTCLPARSGSGRPGGIGRGAAGGSRGANDLIRDGRGGLRGGLAATPGGLERP
jgi:hypothetical protein